MLTRNRGRRRVEAVDKCERGAEETDHEGEGKVEGG